MSTTNTTTPITYEYFTAVDLRVGIVRSCERLPRKARLLKLKVDLGEPELRPIVASLAQAFEPEALVGRRVVVLANLEPRDFGGGLVSKGMLIAPGTHEAPLLATVEGEITPGMRLT